jgi:RNA polymerase sigma-70 factor (ECF subfamily)
MTRESEQHLWAEARAIAARHGRTGASDAADDLAQELVVAALEAGGAARRPGAWLERVGRNAVIDRWRSERRRGELAAALPAPTAPADPESQLLARERQTVVRRGLVALPRPQRQAALLRFHCDLPFEAVAARLGTEPATARTRVHRALAGLRARVQGLRALFIGWQAAQTAVLVVTLAAAAPAGPQRAAASPPPQPAPARRQPAPAKATTPAEPPQPAPEVKAFGVPAVQHMVFGADLIEGDVRGPEGERIMLVRPAPQPSLIEIRHHFLPEMVKSLEDY